MKIRVKASERRSRRTAPWVAAGTLAAYTALGSRSAALAKGVEVDTTLEEAPAEQGQQPVLRYDIAAGALETVLAAYQSASGVVLTLPADSIKSLSSPGVSGVYTAEQALQKLLSGSGVTFRFSAPDAAALQVRLRESVEVTASVRAVASPKYTEPLRDIPQTITVIPRSVIEEQNATTLRDVLRNVPGITIQAGEGGVPAGDNLTIRGFSARTDIFVDGVRDFGGYSRDPYNMEQVEVAKGPASSWAGRGSTGGSVNMVSKAPQAATSRAGAAGFGNESYKRFTADVNQPITALSGAVFRLNGMFTDTDVARRDAVENRRWGLAPSIAFGLGSSTRGVVQYSHLDQDNTPDYGIPWVPAGTTGPLAPYAGQAPPVESSNFYGLTTRDYEETRTDMVTASVEHDFNPRFTLRNQLRYGRNDRDSVITSPRFVNASSPTQYELINRQLQSRDMTDTILSNQTSATTRFTTGRVEHALVSGLDLGVEGSTNYIRTGPTAPQANLFEPNPGDPYPGPITRTGAVNDGQATSLGLYAFDTLHFGSKFEVTGGLRWDHFDVDFEGRDAAGVVTPFDRTDELFSWRAGVVYKPKPNGSVYAGVGTSFNPSAEGLSLAANNVALDPEETQSFEVGSKWDLLAGRLSLTGAIFRTEKTNARTPGVNPGDPPQVLEGEQNVDGIEFGAFGSLGNRATLFAGYAHMRGEVVASNTVGETGGALAQTPENTFNLWLTLRLPKDATVGGGVQYMDSVYRNALNTLQAPSYWLFNATAAFPVTSKLTLRLNAYNLSDEEYVDRVGGGHFVPGPGRYAMLTLDVKF